MANIPLFDDNGGGGQEATVRPTRIGPEEPKALVGQTVEQSTKEFSAVAKQMSYMQDGNDLNMGQLAITNHLNTVRQQLAQQPLSQFTDPQTYMQQAQQLSDPSQLIKGFSGYSLHVQKTLQHNAALMQNDFLKEQQGQALKLADTKLRSDTDTILDGYAQAAGTAQGLQHAALYKQLAMDHIQYAVDNHALTPQEGEAKKAQFNNHVDLAALDDQLVHDPAGAIKTLTGDAWETAYPTLTPEQRMGGIQRGHAALNQETNAAEQFMKQQQGATENELLQRMKDGTLTSAWLDEKYNHSLISPEFYRLATGRKPPQEGNPEAYQMYMTMLQDPNMSTDKMDNLRQQLVGDTASGMSGAEKSAFMVAWTSRRHDMHTPLEIAKKNASSDFEARLGNWSSSFPAGYAAVYKKDIATAERNARAAFNAQLYGLDKEDKVHALVNSFDFSKYMPASAAGAATVAPMPPTLPDDVTRKLAAVKPGA
jgi:hypothetical protein